MLGGRRGREHEDLGVRSSAIAARAGKKRHHVVVVVVGGRSCTQRCGAEDLYMSNGQIQLFMLRMFLSLSFFGETLSVFSFLFNQMLLAFAFAWWMHEAELPTR